MKSLHSRIVLLLAAAGAVALAVVAVAQDRYAGELEQEAGAAVLAARLDGLTAAVRALHEANARQAMAVTRWAHHDSRVLRVALVEGEPNLLRASVIDRQGRVIASSDPLRVGEQAGRPFIAEAMARGGQRFAVEGTSVAYAAPIGKVRDADSAVVLEVPIASLAAPLRDAAAAGISAMLVDSAGRALWRPPQQPEQTGGPAQARQVPGTPWTLIAASPQRQAVLRSGISHGLLACALALVLAFIVQLLAVRRAFEPLRQMTRAAADVAHGNYDARLPLDGSVELDALARTFNEMAEGLLVGRAGLEGKVRERTQALEAMNTQMAARNIELAERSEELARHRYHEQAKGRALAALTADAELDQVVEAALGEVAGPAGAAVMICYRLDGQELVPVAAYAASEAARTQTVPLAGIAENALRKGRVEVLDEVPEGLDLRFDCLIAAGQPRAMALIPLKVGNRPTGILAVGALAPLPRDALTTLSDLASPLALTMARRSLLEHTERIARELARRNEELRDQAEALEAQGEELKAQQRELEVKNREVAKADKLKSEFLANMSHELRTPLNAVIGFSELLLEDHASLSHTQQQWVNDIQESGRHLLTLINRVLDLAKIEAGRTSFRPEAVAPADAVASACTLVRPSAQKRNIAIGVIEGPAPAVSADRGHLNQVLINLLANAVKFSPEGASVEVGYAQEGESVRFWVTDQGPGIDEETQRRLFEPFFQAESPLVKKHEGTGLGLAISRKLIEAQGGKIGVQSAPGAGSTFFFALPLAGEAPVPEIPQQPIGTLDFAGKPPLVLVVDDHDLNRNLAREMLERRGCRVILARDGEEAVFRARADHPNLVLLDLAMPRMDGFAVARELKRDPGTAHIPLVALTALAMRGDDERVLQAGFDGYLPKPLERAALDATLTRLRA